MHTTRKLIKQINNTVKQDASNRRDQSIKWARYGGCAMICEVDGEKRVIEKQLPFDRGEITSDFRQTFKSYGKAFQNNLGITWGGVIYHYTRMHAHKNLEVVDTLSC